MKYKEIKRRAHRELQFVEQERSRFALETPTECLNKIQAQSDTSSILNKARFETVQGVNICAILDVLKEKFCGSGALTIHKCSLCPKTILIIDELIKDYNLKNLVFSKCTFDDAPCKSIIDASSLFLSFKSCDIGHTTCDAIVNLITNCNLQKLTFLRCNFADDSLERIVRAINGSSLAILCLGTIIFDERMTDAIISCIENTPLTQLSLTNCTFFETNIAAVIDATTKSPIRRLDLNKISLESATENICRALESALFSILWITNCSLTNHALLLLVNTIKSNVVLEQISFSGNAIGCENATAICDLLENSGILAINLSKCSLNESNMIKIIDAIKRSSILTLSLNGNVGAFTSASIAALCDLLENYPLRKLFLDDNELTDETMLALLPSVKRSALVHLSVDQNFIKRATMKEIRGTLREQKKIIRRFKKTKGAIKS